MVSAAAGRGAVDAGFVRGERIRVAGVRQILLHDRSAREFLHVGPRRVVGMVRVEVVHPQEHPARGRIGEPLANGAVGAPRTALDHAGREALVVDVEALVEPAIRE